MHGVEGEMVCRLTHVMIPYFNAGIYLENKSKSRVTLEEIEEISEPPKELFQSGFEERYWLKNHGKEEFINFTDKALLELRKYFESLDDTGTGSIGVEQLEDPFIAFGLS